MNFTGGRRAADRDVKGSLYQQVQPSVLRMAVLDDTYGCVQHIRDLQKADLGAAADASAASQPKQLQARSPSLLSSLHSAFWQVKCRWYLIFDKCCASYNTWN